MEFEWDEDKNRSNIAKHGIGFARAARVFDGLTIDWADEGADHGEQRTISLGMIEAVLILVVVHTDRDGVTRIISARPARRAERRSYDEEIRKRIDG